MRVLQLRVQMKYAPSSMIMYKNTEMALKNYTYIYADSYTGQNRNNTLKRMLLFYTDTQMFKKVVLHFPVRGHSFMPCDRDFGTLKRQFKLCDRIYTPKEYVEEIMLSTQKEKFTIVMVPTEIILNFKKWWNLFYKKNSISLETAGRQCKKPDKIHFQVLKFYQFEFCTTIPGCVLARDYIDGLKVHTCIQCIAENPHLFVLKCVCHSFHLCASYACLKLSREPETLIRDNYFNNSPKRTGILRVSAVLRSKTS